MQNDILKSSFWEKAWQEFRIKTAPPDTRNFDQAEKWNKRAQSFAQHTGGAHGQKRIKQVFNFLQQFIEFKEGMSVLDIGCGPGNFAIPLADNGMQVTALDPAINMLKIIQDNLPPQLSDRINLVQGLWESINIARLSWVKKFDLVFASMSPGVREKETLEKMILCSKKFCFLSSFAGPRQNTLYEKLWPYILDRKFKNHVSDIIFPFNLLYTMGYKPALQFADTSHLREDTPEHVMNEIKDLIIAEEGLFTNPQKEKVNEFLAKHTENNKISYIINSTVGMLIWKVD